MALITERSNVPFRVVNFERLMYASIVLALFQTTLYWGSITEEFQDIEPETGAWTIVIYTAVLCLLTWQVAREHENWARWTLLLLGVMGLLAPHHQHSSLHRTLLYEALGYGAWITEAVALLLIFTGDARDWFERITSHSLPFV